MLAGDKGTNTTYCGRVQAAVLYVYTIFAVEYSFSNGRNMKILS